ncbi:hypothetical protein Nepgr_025400 [Nepenthes gracilis]|uniref:CWF21 domain-containing protein n=1 Tax=Nepenthes gracilis TaxID=150966 RepID=A0AAD3T6D1_NEPGR|nr:hypothetical protein Nepgr_025400 [Nepenthes gracilis]
MEPVGLSGWNHYGEDEMRSQGKGPTSMTQTHLNTQAELKVLLRKDKVETVLPASKWAQEDDESDDGQKQSSRGLDLSYSYGSENAGYGSNKNDEREFPTDASMSSQPESGLNEEQRQKLRRLEVALMEYRESLEERAVRSLEEIERKVTIYRKRLQSEYGLSDSNEDVSLNIFFKILFAVSYEPLLIQLLFAFGILDQRLPSKVKPELDFSPKEWARNEPSQTVLPGMKLEQGTKIVQLFPHPSHRYRSLVRGPQPRQITLPEQQK